MKILFVITGLGVGGAERQIVDIADRLVSLGHDVKIAFLTGPALIQPCSDKIQTFGFEMPKTISGFVRAYLKLRNLINSYRPDVIHSHMVHANLITRLVRLSCQIPKLICTAHSKNEGGKIRMLAYRLTDPLADVSTNVSAEAVSAFEVAGAVKHGRMIAMHNGIDTERFQPADAARIRLRKLYSVREDEKIITAVGRLNVAKDYPNLLHAFADVLQNLKNVQLWIVGDGELRKNLEDEAVKLNIESRVRFCGVQYNVADWMNAADVFVLSSAWEGFGLVVAEAMACEKVVVATDAGGVKEVLGDSGFLVPTRDAVALSYALKNALSLDQSEALDIGIQARKRVVSLYSIEHVVERWLDVYGFKGAHSV